MVEWGVNAGLSASSAEPDCAAIAALGGSCVRTSQELGWSNWHDTLLKFRAAADNHGLKLMNTCQPINHVAPATQKAKDDYAAYVAECAKICDWCGIANEPNGYGNNYRNGQGKLVTQPSLWAENVMACIEARDRLAIGKILVTPELQPAGGGLTDSAVEPLLWFDAMVTAQPGILAARKVWPGWHGYCSGPYPAWTEEKWNQFWRQRALDADIMGRIHKHRRIVNGEYGCSVAPHSDQSARNRTEQAQRLRDYLTELQRQEAVGIKHGPWFWYTLRDRRTTNPGWVDMMGLLDINGNRNLVGDVFHELATAAA